MNIVSPIRVSPIRYPSSPDKLHKDYRGVLSKKDDRVVILSGVTVPTDKWSQAVLGVGKVVVFQDDFLDDVTQWHYYYHVTSQDLLDIYPDFKSKSTKVGDTEVWSLLVPIAMLQDGWSIALIGNGRWNRDQINILLDLDRLESLGIG